MSELYLVGAGEVAQDLLLHEQLAADEEDVAESMPQPATPRFQTPPADVSRQALLHHLPVISGQFVSRPCSLEWLKD